MDYSMAALGEIICRMNPYTEIEDTTTNSKTGEMQLETNSQLAAAQNAQAPAAANAPHAAQVAAAVKAVHDERVAAIEGVIQNLTGVEVANNYQEQWSFKGQKLNIKTAVRIPYQFSVQKNGGKPYWQTEFLVIGYAGGGGMG